jgi:hypothetical protein
VSQAVWSASSPACAKSASGQRKLYQPTSFDAVVQRRHHALCPDRSFHPRPAGLCTPCSPCGHCRCCCLLHSIHRTSTFLPAFPRRGFAVRAFRGSSPLRYYAGSASCRTLARPTGLSAYAALPSGHPVLNHVVSPERRFVSHLSAFGRPLAVPGFTLDEQARRYTPPNQVRHPTGCPFASGCSPPHLTVTQLPSATCDVTSHDVDFHHANNADSRTHSSRASCPGPIVQQARRKLLRREREARGKQVRSAQVEEWVPGTRPGMTSEHMR